MSWPSVALCELGQVVTGSTPSSKDDSAFGHDVPFVTPGDLDKSQPLVTASRYLTTKAAMAARLLPEGSVLVSCIGTLGKIAIAGREVVSNQQINAIVFNTDIVFPKFGYYACRNLKRQLDTIAPATTLPIVSKSKFEALCIPIPPLEEQRRIAAILDQAEELRAQRRAAIALLDQLPQAIFIEMFGDPATNPMGWPIRQLAQVAGKVDYGVTASATMNNCGPKFLRITDIQEGRVNWDSVPYCECSDRDRTDSRLYPGDLVFARTGATTGKSYLITACPDDSVFASYLIRVRASKQVEPVYLAQFFQSNAYWTQINTRMRGAGQPGVNSSSLREIALPVPPLDLQSRFASRVETIHRAKAAHQSALVQLNDLFFSLNSCAFDP